MIHTSNVIAPCIAEKLLGVIRQVVTILPIYKTLPCPSSGPSLPSTCSRGDKILKHILVPPVPFYRLDIVVPHINDPVEALPVPHGLVHLRYPMLNYYNEELSSLQVPAHDVDRYSLQPSPYKRHHIIYRRSREQDELLLYTNLERAPR